MHRWARRRAEALSLIHISGLLVHDGQDGILNAKTDQQQRRAACHAQHCHEAVSYTHLDVYKRQQRDAANAGFASCRKLNLKKTGINLLTDWVRAVSYTHLDVYKRQVSHSFDSSPKGGALGKTENFAVLPRPLTLGEVARRKP